ncbi:MAG: LysE family translocator [Anaerolineae bacterium]
MLPHFTHLFTYVAIVSVFVLVPGPSVLLTVAKSIASGTRAGLMTALGIAVGDVVHTTLAVFGVSAILMASALAFTIVKYLGAAYLVYLGLKALLQQSASLELPSSERAFSQNAFIRGFLCEVLNPKSALFFLAFLPQFIDSATGYPQVQLAVLGLLFIRLGVISTCSYALAAGRVGSFLKAHAGWAKWQDKLVGGLYCALAVRLALQER